MEQAAEPSLDDAPGTGFLSYAQTRQGSLLLLEMVLCSAIAICNLYSYYVGYIACPLVELVFAGIFYWVYMNGYHRTMTSLNWTWTDIFRCVSAAVILLVISLINVTRRHAGNVIGGLFGFTAIAVFLYNVYFLHPKCPSRPQPRDDPPAYTP
ncbi:proteolipid protein 2-like [Scyliorhinus torazame]|uniref:proteolipid protein 2-like n=1 Tax=Scyliorhinus torazame TaxID=75743 RepID=UPI003B5C6210